MTYVLVTGTSTGVGKTITTAALAVALADAGLRVGVVKPVQTGSDEDEPTDVDVVRRLAVPVDAVELATLADPLAPDTAARLRGVSTPSVADLATRTAAFGEAYEVVIVEGAGGVLVRLDTDGATLLDLGRALVSSGRPVAVVVVTTLALGTLNHTELTAMAARGSGLPVAGLVIGSAPAAPLLAETCNLTELPRVTGLPLLGAIPGGAGAYEPDAFRAAAPGWLPGAGSAVGAAAR